MKTTKTVARKTTRKSNLNKKQLHAVYSPAAKIAWITIFAKRAKSAKTASDKKMYLTKMREQLAKLPTTLRAHYRELQAA
jgi:hypothetical protein